MHTQADACCCIHSGWVTLRAQDNSRFCSARMWQVCMHVCVCVLMYVCVHVYMDISHLWCIFAKGMCVDTHATCVPVADPFTVTRCLDVHVYASSCHGWLLHTCASCFRDCTLAWHANAHLEASGSCTRRHTHHRIHVAGSNTETLFWALMGKKLQTLTWIRYGVRMPVCMYVWTCLSCLSVLLTVTQLQRAQGFCSTLAIQPCVSYALVTLNFHIQYCWTARPIWAERQRPCSLTRDSPKPDLWCLLFWHL
jgi:hypothetical protein